MVTLKQVIANQPQVKSDFTRHSYLSEVAFCLFFSEKEREVEKVWQ